MGGSNAARVNKRGDRRGMATPVTVGATEEWSMRVNPEWLARVKVKAADWGLTTSELIRVLVDQGLENDLAMLYPPDGSEETLTARVRREKSLGYRLKHLGR